METTGAGGAGWRGEAGGESGESGEGGLERQKYGKGMDKRRRRKKGKMGINILMVVCFVQLLFLNY